MAKCAIESGNRLYQRHKWWLIWEIAVLGRKVCGLTPRFPRLYDKISRTTGEIGKYIKTSPPNQEISLIYDYHPNN